MHLSTAGGGHCDTKFVGAKGRGRMVMPLILIVFTAGLIASNPYPAKAAEKASSTMKKRAEYLIGPEDVLEISVWKNQDLSRLVTVRPDGMVTLPLLGDIRAADRAPSALRDEIVDRLKQYQKSAEVSVIVQEVNSYRIFILGDVTRPGIYPLKSRTTILQAIAIAGGFNEFASKNKIVLIREKGHGKKKQQKIKIQFGDIVNVKKSKDSNLVLMPGDTIFVP